jgi:hypothetical protein
MSGSFRNGWLNFKSNLERMHVLKAIGKSCPAFVHYVVLNPKTIDDES